MKQSLRAWFDQFIKAIKRYRYHQSQVDHTLFYKHQVKLRFLYLLFIWMIFFLIRDDAGELEDLKTVFVKELIKKIYFFSMEFARSKRSICLSKEVFIKLIEED